MNITINADDIKSKLKRAWDENPVLVVAIAATSLSGVSKLMNANSARKNAQSWKQEVKRRTEADRAAYRKR